MLLSGVTIFGNGPKRAIAGSSKPHKDGGLIPPRQGRYCIRRTPDMHMVKQTARLRSAVPLHSGGGPPCVRGVSITGKEYAASRRNWQLKIGSGRGFTPFFSEGSEAPRPGKRVERKADSLFFHKCIFMQKAWESFADCKTNFANYTSKVLGVLPQSVFFVWKKSAP